MIYLTEEEIFLIAQRVVGDVLVRDHGLISAAVARPRASAFGEDAYQDLETKAAALLQSITRNHALVDGNKRLAWAAAVVFYDLNGLVLDPPSVDEAVELVVAVAGGQMGLGKLSERLAGWAHEA